jgi:HAMP domain-containing protein
MDPNNQAAPESQPAPVINQVNDGQRKVGPIIGTLVIVLILIIAALYLFASRVNQEPTPSDSSSDAAAVSQTVEPITGTADDASSLEADLNRATQGLDNQNF